jgi:Uma2 family endonuclease
VSIVASELLARAQHAVDEILPKGTRVEVLDGTLVVNPPPSYHHALTTAQLGEAISRVVPGGCEVNWAGLGVYERDSADAEYQIPDITVFRPLASGRERITGADVELVVEIVSPANRRMARYEQTLADRAERYGIAWVLVVDPATRTATWWAHGGQQGHGPGWAEGVALDSLWP